MLFNTSKLKGNSNVASPTSKAAPKGRFISGVLQKGAGLPKQPGHPTQGQYPALSGNSSATFGALIGRNKHGLCQYWSSVAALATLAANPNAGLEQPATTTTTTNTGFMANWLANAAPKQQATTAAQLITASGLPNGTLVASLAWYKQVTGNMGSPTNWLGLAATGGRYSAAQWLDCIGNLPTLDNVHGNWATLVATTTKAIAALGKPNPQVATCLALGFAPIVIGRYVYFVRIAPLGLPCNQVPTFGRPCGIALAWLQYCYPALLDALWRNHLDTYGYLPPLKAATKAKPKAKAKPAKPAKPAKGGNNAKA